MLGDTFRKSHLRYALSHWVLPRLGTEPLATKNLSQKAWPTVAALTSSHDYADQIESIDWESKGDDDGTDLLEDYARTSRAVVLKGYAASSTEASWTLERVKEEVGDVILPVRVGDYVSAPGEPESVMMRVADYVDYVLGQAAFPHPGRLVDGMSPYLSNMHIPAIAKQLPCPRFFGKAINTTFWMGMAGSSTPLHCHQHGDVLILQLVGRRRVMLAPPHQALLVGYVPVNVNVCTAEFDPFASDQHQFPGTDGIHRLHYELEPGDALLIPGFWFHAIQLAEPSLSASHFRTTMPAAIGGGPVGPWRTRSYSRGW